MFMGTVLALLISAMVSGLAAQPQPTLAVMGV
jgi:hypothetical protein